MKYPPAIYTAAATAVTALVGSVVADALAVIDVDPDAASAVPLITARLVEKLALAGGTDREIADRFDVDIALIQEKYCRLLRTCRAVRSIALRGFQFDLAKKGNGPMLIWLGRNELGQSLNPTAPEEPLPEIDEDLIGADSSRINI